MAAKILTLIAKRTMMGLSLCHSGNFTHETLVSFMPDSHQTEWRHHSGKCRRYLCWNNYHCCFYVNALLATPLTSLKVLADRLISIYKLKSVRSSSRVHKVEICKTRETQQKFIVIHHFSGLLQNCRNMSFSWDFLLLANSCSMDP